MRTREIRESRPAIARHRPGAAALAAAIALTLFLPFTPGARSGAASPSARTPASAVIIRGGAHAPVPDLRSGRETGCCA